MNMQVDNATRLWVFVWRVKLRLNRLLLLVTRAGHFAVFGVSAGSAELSIMGSGWCLIVIHWRKCMSVTCLRVRDLYAIVLKPLTSLEGIQGHCGLSEGNYIPDFLCPQSPQSKVYNFLHILPMWIATQYCTGKRRNQTILLIPTNPVK